MAFALAAALLFALDRVLVTAAYASLGGPSGFVTYKDLVIASAWLDVAAGVAALTGVVGALWLLIVRRQAPAAWEAAGATVGTLLLAIGALVRAVTALQPPDAANVLVAIGVGVWAILAMVVAARWALVGEGSELRTANAPAWLWAAAALVVLAVGLGFPTGSFADKGLAIAKAVIMAVGFAALAGAVGYAYVSRLVSRTTFATVVGLAILATGQTVLAIAAGLVIQPAPSLTGIRVGFSLASVIMAVGFVLLAYAAWERLRRLSPPSVHLQGQPAAEATGPGTHAPRPVYVTRDVVARFCVDCGCPLPTDARFCPRCGVAIVPREA